MIKVNKEVGHRPKLHPNNLAIRQTGRPRPREMYKGP